MDILTVERKDRAMVIWTSVLLPLALLILLFLRQLWSRRHFPPGPLSFPFIGNIWVLGSTLKKDSFIKLAKRYGNIYTLWLGDQPAIVLSGFKAVKEGLVGFAEEFAGRPKSVLYKFPEKVGDLSFTNGHIWEEQRHTANVIWRQLGVGSKSIEPHIEEAACQIVENFARRKGQPFDPSFPLICFSINLICLLCYGYQFDPEDEKFHKLLQPVKYLAEFAGSFFHLMYEGLPWLMEHIPGPHKKAVTSVEQILSFSKLEIENHRKHQNLHEPQDFIDFYLLQIDKCKNDPNSTINEESLTFIINDLMFAAANASYATMKWALLLLANHPNIQEKVHKEIEDVFGSSGSISYQDKKKMPYTHAVMHEIMRAKYSNLVPPPRQIMKDVKMQGFHIPKGTIVIADLQSVLRDPQQWETPEEFNPNHFLDTDGHFKAREGFLPFGAGNRTCFGQKLARAEIFIILVHLLKSFCLKPPEGKLDETPIPNMVMHPPPYQICAVPHPTLS